MNAYTLKNNILWVDPKLKRGKYKMTEFLYRFRSTEKILKSPWNEWENREIFFSAPEHLNDPVEGYKDLFWAGDEIVWKNLLQHYLMCLEQICGIFIVDKDYLITANDIPVFFDKK